MPLPNPIFLQSLRGNTGNEGNLELIVCFGTNIFQMIMSREFLYHSWLFIEYWASPPTADTKLTGEDLRERVSVQRLQVFPQQLHLSGNSSSKHTHTVTHLHSPLPQGPSSSSWVSWWWRTPVSPITATCCYGGRFHLNFIDQNILKLKVACRFRRTLEIKWDQMFCEYGSRPDVFR